MKIVAIVAPFSSIALPFVAAGQQETGAHSFSPTALEALGRDTLTAIHPFQRQAWWSNAGSPRNLRHVEFTEACNNTYNELWTDQAMNDAFDTYSANYEASLLVATSSTYTCTNDGNNFVCDLDSRIEGEEAFQSSCSSAGGAINSVSLDIYCF